MFGFIAKMFFVFLTRLGNPSNHTKCVSFSNKKCEIQPIYLIQP